MRERNPVACVGRLDLAAETHLYLVLPLIPVEKCAQARDVVPFLEFDDPGAPRLPEISDGKILVLLAAFEVN